METGSKIIDIKKIQFNGEASENAEIQKQTSIKSNIALDSAKVNLLMQGQSNIHEFDSSSYMRQYNY